MPGTLARAKLKALVVALRPGYERHFSGSNANRVFCKKVLLVTTKSGELSKRLDLLSPLHSPVSAK